jgi:hypothetical protein
VCSSDLGKITNLWGKSGTGKTIVAISLALAELGSGGKVLYLSDEPRDVAVKLAMIFKQDRPGHMVFPSLLDGLMLVRIKHFANQTDMIEHLPFAFMPSQDIANSSVFKDFVDDEENFLNEWVVKSFEAYHPPALVIIDEFTRLFKRQSIGGDPGDLNPQLAIQLGFLKTIARDHGVKIVVTSSSKTILTMADKLENEKFIEVPLVNNLFEYYADLDAQITWTGRAGERAITVSGNDGKQGRLYVDLADLHKMPHEV